MPQRFFGFKKEQDKTCAHQYMSAAWDNMNVKTFKGGVHPSEMKEMSLGHPVETYLPKGDLVFPVSQHIGKPAKPVVAKGDHVLAGQVIAEAGGDDPEIIYAEIDPEECAKARAQIGSLKNRRPDVYQLAGSVRKY